MKRYTGVNERAAKEVRRKLKELREAQKAKLAITEHLLKHPSAVFYRVAVGPPGGPYEISRKHNLEKAMASAIKQHSARYGEGPTDTFVEAEYRGVHILKLRDNLW